MTNHEKARVFLEKMEEGDARCIELISLMSSIFLMPPQSVLEEIVKLAHSD